MHISTRNKLKNFGFRRYCPICNSFLKYFKPAGGTGRPDAVCPVCGSYERHRLVWLFFKHKTSLFTHPMSMLHAAPENCFIRRLKARPNLQYISIDLQSPLADRKIDLTALDFPSNSFDFFYAGHVLEHIPQDLQAISNIYRVLKPGGKALIMVPISGQFTQEDPTITTPSQRKERYGQEDHVRIYGDDFIQRLQSVPFQVQSIQYYSSFSKFSRRYMSLSPETIFYCTK